MEETIFFFPFRKNPTTFFRRDFRTLFTFLDMFLVLMMFEVKDEVEEEVAAEVVVVEATVDDDDDDDEIILFAAISDLMYALSDPMIASMPVIFFLVSTVVTTVGDTDVDSPAETSRGLADREVCD